MGRPPAGRDAEGRPVPTRSYPQLTVRIRTEAKRELKLLGRLIGASQGDVIEKALEVFVRGLPSQDRQTLERWRRQPGADS